MLNYALEPALADHISRLDAIADDRAAADAFFDFRVADIAMGSGHFLVAAIDRIERSLSSYLVKRQLTDVIAELARLRNSAREALGPLADSVEIEDAQLLRRQIARRCIYGVDLNPIAVELARLSVWIHTFIPGLPLSFLDHNLVVGNSLVGIATIEEADEWLKEISAPLWALSAEKLLGHAREALGRLGRVSDADAAEIEAARKAARRGARIGQRCRGAFRHPDGSEAGFSDERAGCRMVARKRRTRREVEKVARFENSRERRERVEGDTPFSLSRCIS